MLFAEALQTESGWEVSCPEMASQVFGGWGSEGKALIPPPAVLGISGQFPRSIHCKVALFFFLLFLLTQLLIKEWPLKISQATAHPFRAGHRQVPSITAG